MADPGDAHFVVGGRSEDGFKHVSCRAAEHAGHDPVTQKFVIADRPSLFRFDARITRCLVIRLIAVRVLHSGYYSAGWVGNPTEKLVEMKRARAFLLGMTRLFRSSLVLWISLVVSCSGGEKKTVMETKNDAPAEPTGKVVKTDDEWEKVLTAEQYRILRQAGTERANGEVYKEFKKQGQGSYHCAGCGALLFSSAQKFDSGCGWPSFFDPAKAENVRTKVDHSGGMTRTEVICAKCDGHLGHVFEGEGFDTPTDKRYCINGGGLVFVPAKKPETK